MLHVACCMLHVACYMLHVACRMLHVTCCILHVACCMLRARPRYCMFACASHASKPARIRPVRTHAPRKYLRVTRKKCRLVKHSVNISYMPRCMSPPKSRQSMHHHPPQTAQNRRRRPDTFRRAQTRTRMPMPTRIVFDCGRGAGGVCHSAPVTIN